MKQNYYAQKVRQLKRLSKKLQFLQQLPEGLSSGKSFSLIQKIKKLVSELQGVFSRRYLKRILGSAAVLIGLTVAQPVSAQSFLKPVANPFGLQAADTVGFPAFADLDGDGDMDLMVAETLGQVEYFQNTGTATMPHFAAPVNNPFGLDTLRKDTNINLVLPTFADLDGDGDMDLLFGEYNGYNSYNGAFLYFQNTGTRTNPHFAAPVVNPFGLDSIKGLEGTAFVDLDGDGDMDLLVGRYYGVLDYFQNTGTVTQPHFAAPVKNPFHLKSTYYYAFPAFADIDNDGDQDLLVGEYTGNLEYFQNTGTATKPYFAPMVKNPFGFESAYYYATPSFADLDGDGDMDLLVGQLGQSSDGQTQDQDVADLIYYENNLISTGIKPSLNHDNVVLFPNPVSDYLSIQTDKKIEKIEVFDIQGKKVDVFHSPMNKIALSPLKAGIYMVKISFEKGQFVLRKIQKQ